MSGSWTINSISLRNVNFSLAKGDKITLFWCFFFWSCYVSQSCKCRKYRHRMTWRCSEHMGDVCEWFISFLHTKPPARISKHFPYVQFCPIWIHVSGQTATIQTSSGWREPLTKPLVRTSDITAVRPTAWQLTSHWEWSERSLRRGWQNLTNTPPKVFMCRGHLLVSLLRMPICYVPTKK